MAFKDEQGYIDQLKTIMDLGKFKDDRTGVGVVSMFGSQTRYNLKDGKFPLFTIKKMCWKAIVEELLWFISGSTDSTVLADKGVKIWNAHGSKNFLTKQGFHNRKEGDLGPIYGFQWRHWGASYISCDSNYDGKGYDQLESVIQCLKTNPNSRRMIVCSWNVNDLQNMALPPCHLVYQFYACAGELSCQVYQRSADMGLGVPFNVASYALLVYIVGHLTNLKPTELIHVLGDAHIYLNHLPILQQLLNRKVLNCPTLKIVNTISNLNDFKADDFQLENYQSHDAIKLPLAV